MSIILVTVALIGTTGAYILDYSDETFRTVYPSDPNPVKAEFIKANTEISLRKGKPEEHYAITLYPDEIPNVSQDDLDMCGKYHGLYLVDSQDAYCQISHISLVTHSLSDDEQGLYISVFFKEGFLGPLRLNISVFQMPDDGFEQTASELNELLLLDWASDCQVGLPTVNEEKYLDDIPWDIFYDRSVKLEFEWLNNLLKYGIFKAPTSAAQGNSYVTRPVLLPAETIDQFLELIVYNDDTEHTFSSF